MYTILSFEYKRESIFEPSEVFEVEGNFTETISSAEKKFGGFDPQTGLTRTIWGGWQTLWTGVKTNTRVRRRKESTKSSRVGSYSGSHAPIIERTRTTRAKFNC